MKQPDSHETYAVAARRLHWAALILLGSLLLIALAMYRLAVPLMRSVAELTVSAPPPAPQLQPDPVRDLATLREREQEALTTYGWVDRNQGIARIPIERAMQLLARPTSANVPPLPATNTAPPATSPDPAHSPP
jgi:hypothetical protein